MRKKCDVCKKISVWDDGESYYCENHFPIDIKENVWNRKSKQIPVDEDVVFLTYIADVLAKAEITSPYADRLRDVGRRIQNVIDEGIILQRNLRKHSIAPPPEFKDSIGFAVLGEIRKAEYSRFNAVGRLGEIYQKMDMPLPKYTYTKEGEHHKPRFICTVMIVTPSGNNFFMAQGKTKKEAKQEAAIKALESYLVRNTAIG